MKAKLAVLWGLILMPLFNFAANHKIIWDGKTFTAHYTEVVSPEKARQSLSIHFPLQAYLDKNSFLNDQLREFQDPDLHFASEEELAQLEIIQLKVNGKPISHQLDSEFLAIPKNSEEGIRIEIEYRFQMPEAKFTGNGRLKEELRLIDILPRLYSSSEKAQPQSYYYDIAKTKENYYVELDMPEEWAAVSNLKHRKAKNGNWVFEGEARQFQLFLSKSWYSYELEEGINLILPQADEGFKLNFELALKELGNFFKNELDQDLSKNRSYLFLDDKKGEYQSAGLISLERPKKWDDLRIDLAQAIAESFFRYTLNTNGWQNPWMARGIPYYYKYHFIEENYPQKRWIPFQSPILNGLFGFDAFDFGYQNRFLFLFLQRQGLDQAMSAPVDSLSRLNYEAISQAKSYLSLSHLRAYTGDKDFKRALRRFYHEYAEKTGPEELKASFEFYSPKPLDWFFEDVIQTAEIYDYQLKSIDYCATVSTATVYNSGDLAIPYALTGFIDGKPVLTEWYAGHTGEKSVQMYHSEYDKVVLNAHLRHAEYRQKNNIVYNRWLFPRAEPLSFQLYNSFEAAEASQVFYVPSLYYNAYDKFLLGINLSNRSILVQKPFEWLVVPEYSTGTGKITGTASLAYNWTLPKNALFRQVKFGVYSRYNHYDRDLAYYRISPSINFYIRKPHPRSPYIQSLRFRAVILNREQAPNQTENLNRIESASYSVFNANYRMEYTSLLRPTIFRSHIELGGRFGKVFAECDQRWMLPNKKWLILRGFAGAFLYNDAADAGQFDNFYSFGLSGTPDYLFDYYLIGRSDQTGIWSRQFFTTDGGFKSETQAFADQFLLSSNLSVPIIGPLGAFADVALSEEQMYWDYGVRLALLTDFLEVYFPIQNQDRNFYSEANYAQNLRFVLDLNLGSIINRLRRGYY